MTRTLVSPLAGATVSEYRQSWDAELLGLLPAPFAAAQADAHDAPVLLSRQGKTAVDVEGLMRAMEVAHAEMGDTAFEAASVIGRRRDVRRQPRKRAGVEFGHVALSKQAVLTSR